MPAFVNPDTVQRATAGATVPASWGDTVNDDLNSLNALTTTYAMAHQASAQSIPSTTTTVVNLDTVDADPGSGITVGASWHYTVPVAGRYRVNARVSFVSGISGGVAQAYIFVGATVLRRGAFAALSGLGTGISPVCFVSGVIVCAVSDQINIAVFQNSGSAQNTTPGVSFGTVDIKRES